MLRKIKYTLAYSVMIGYSMAGFILMAGALGHKPSIDLLYWIIQ